MFIKRVHATDSGRASWPRSVDPPEHPSLCPLADAYRDVTFALLFVLHLVGVLAIAIVNGTRVAALSSPPSAPASPSKPAISLATASAETMTTLAVASTSSAVLALIWLAIIQTGARVIIFLGASAGTMLALGNAVWLLANGGAAGITLGLLSLAFCVVCIATILLNKRTLDFSALLVSTVALVLRAFPATLLVAAIGAILGVLWLLLWSSALASTLQLSNQGASIALLVLSFFWTLQTIKAVVHTTIAGPLPLRRGLQTAEGVRAMATASHWAVRRCCIFWTTARGYCFLRTPCPMEKTHAGTIGSWYFLSPNVPPRPTACSLRRACTTSFGSLCLGALLASTLQVRSLSLCASLVAKSFFSPFSIAIPLASGDPVHGVYDVQAVALPACSTLGRALPFGVCRRPFPLLQRVCVHTGTSWTGACGG